LGEHALAALERDSSRPERPDDKEPARTTLHVSERERTGER
jgi:hypothetical protein